MTCRGLLCLCLLIVLVAVAVGCSSSEDAASRHAAPTGNAGEEPSTSLPGATDETPDVPSGEEGGSAVYPANAVYAQRGEAKAESGQAYTAAEDDQSAILVTDGGSFLVTSATIETTGNTSSDDSSHLYGLNAAVVATAGSSIFLRDCSITTTGSGASGAFAAGEGARVTLAGTTIEAAGDGAHGVVAMQGGSVTLNDVDIVTAGTDSAPLAAGPYGGSIEATGGSVLSSGCDSPALFSTGMITVTGGRYEATGAEAAVIEGAGTIILSGAELSSAAGRKAGVMIYHGMSNKAEESHGTFLMSGGSLSSTGADSPLFYVTGSTGIIDLHEVRVSCASGLLLRVEAESGSSSDADGGVAMLTARGESLTGDLAADSLSSISLNLDSWSLLVGAINSRNAAKRIDLTVGASSVWIVTGDSHLTTLTLPAGVSGPTIANIFGNGHTVYYDATDPANSALAGLTYELAGGGTLTPVR
jgi:hypothetical protein